MQVIAIEGISGSGKSTFAEAMVAEFKSLGASVFHVGGMQAMRVQNPINEFVASQFLSKDRFIRLPYWSETLLLMSNMLFNSELIACQQVDVVIRENYLAGFQAFQAARTLETPSIDAAHARHSLRILPSLLRENAPDVTYWITTPIELIHKRLQGRERDSALAYSSAEDALQQAIVVEYVRVLSQNPNAIQIQNESTAEALRNSAAKEAARMWSGRRSISGKQKTVYIAGPLFTPGERKHLEDIDKEITKRGLSTYLPHRDGGLATTSDSGKTATFFESDVRAVLDCDAVLAVLGGPDVDSGTAWEIGFAYALGKPVYGYYNDTRAMDVNLMILNSSDTHRSLAETLDVMTAKLKVRS